MLKVNNRNGREISEIHGTLSVTKIYVSENSVIRNQ